MAKEKTENCCFKSEYGGGWITSGQFLAEKMCARFATSQKQKLPLKFWQDKYWCKKFLLQLKHANDLLKKYNIELIMSALDHPDAKRVHSLGLHSVLVPLIEQERLHRKIRKNQNQKKEPVEPINIDITEKPRPVFSPRGKSSLNKLRDLDNG